MEKYQINKTIRFKLIPVTANALKQKADELEKIKAETESVYQLINLGLEIIKYFKEHIYWDFQEKPSHKLRAETIIHYSWLRTYTKNLFYDWRKASKERTKKYSLTEVGYLKDELREFIANWEACLNQLQTNADQPEEKQVRRSDIADSIKKLKGRSFFPFLSDFVKETSNKDSDEIKDKLSKKIKEFYQTLTLCEDQYLPAQSSGIILTKASFNYYTVNKKPKDFEKEKKDIEGELAESFPMENKDNQLLSRLKLEIKDKNIREQHSAVKEFKSSQKFKFEETINKNYKSLIVGFPNDFLIRIRSGAAVVPSRIEEFPLFEIDEEGYKGFLELTKKITQKGTEKSKLQSNSDTAKKLQEEITEIKKERGKYYQKHFKKYVALCKLYEKLAQKVGQLNARLKGIEREKLDSQLLEYWALLLEENGTHKLALIPKDKICSVYAQITKENHSVRAGNIIYYFESLTYRALRKLCFGINGNTFLPEIKEELPEFTHLKGEFKFKKGDNLDEKELISFYQKVLGTDYSKKNIKLPPAIQSEVIEKEITTLNDFKIALEKCCYIRKRVVSDTLRKQILEEAEVFTITSSDLDEKRTSTNLKAHTNLWLDFWKNENEQTHFPLRLNPEIAISYRLPKETRKEKYGKGSANHNPDMKNRYLSEQYSLITTFTENALDIEMNLAFLDVTKKGETILEFNKKINADLKEKDKDNTLYYYGIDAGEIELATLCLAKKANGKIIPCTFKVLELQKLDYQKQGYLWNKGKPVFREKLYKAISNLSYFLNKDLYDKTFRDGKFDETFMKLFKEKEVAVIDLTMAKLIKDKIVINGDITSFLNLKILNAKRKISEILIDNPNACFIEKGYKIFIAKKESEKDENAVFVGRKIFNDIKSFADIKEELEKHFDEKRKDEAKLIEHINRYRRASAANCVGIIHYLYKTYPGIISIEDLKATKVESDREKFAGNIERPLELALYRKFQPTGLVPPVSELLKMRELNKFEQLHGKQYKPIEQFGIIKFVSEKETSTTCPSCREKAYNSEDPKYNEDKKRKIFECKKCGFHNKNNPGNFASLDSNDKVAAFNIAYKGVMEI